ncbi:MAG: MATE family efflux transporter [Chlorobi bacterium]|nr:MATE family efflux transporter [Chlorobiota bacterium]
MKDLTEGKEGKLILNFALPMLMGNVFQQLYNVVDSIIIGKFLGKEALAAVGASFPLIFVLVSFVIGFAIGSTIVIAQYFGAKDMERVKRAVDTLYIFMFFTSLILTFLGIYISKYIFQLIALPSEVIPLAVDYFSIYSLGFVLFFGFQGTSAILRGLGDSRTPVYFLVMSTIVNIALDLFFVLGLGWGIRGVAAATVIAQATAFFAIVFYINKYHRFLDFSPLKMKFDREIFIKSIRIGFPSGIQQTVVSVGFLFLYRIVSIFGTTTIAAYSIAMRIDSFAVMPSLNFSAAISTFVGQNIGAGKTDRIRSGLKATLKISMIISAVISAVAVVFARPIMSVFTNDAEVINIGMKYLYIVSSFYIVMAAMFSLMGLLRGAGDTLTSMFITMFTLWIVRIPASYFLSVKFGNVGIWWGIPIAWCLGLTLSFLYYKTGRWKKKAVVRRNMENDGREGNNE